ncbi:hypothetical protein GRF29_1g3641102 [Pseudopithomyces chartarum]|uniref:Myb-like domain-containing protein n=1 Tax=Pseudopithomyces chartarum TaxID=1892770 RepID=A0AAN6M944_9PLEO|nr:hypothetical protein GRF29_1g3641102 [Pseudopithomyces chartarum]
MEPRIATLLGDSPLERPAADALWLPPPPPSSAGRILSSPLLRTTHSPSQQPAPQRQKPSAPIGDVLNTVKPFSGRLSDLLLDPSPQQLPKRKRDDDAAAKPLPTAPENSLLMLPKPHQQPKKNTKRQRIPPLLQGLHQVPPQAQSRLFPPITSETDTFGRDMGDTIPLRPAGGSKSAKEPSNEASTGSTPMNTPARTPEEAREKEGAKLASGPIGDKENRSGTNAAPGKTKELKKRNKWSDEETKDLLVGVSKFGIGSWKKILQCPDYTFHHRSAVDLKDRFRTCCPGEGLKPRKSKRKSNAHEVTSPDATSLPTPTSTSGSDDPTAPETPNPTSTSRKNRGDSHRKGPAELREMGIHSAFTRTVHRRERRTFTEQDDENLLKGFNKYGSAWHLIRGDVELGFSARQPTDLRDRFRIRYPERFAKAGYKLKAKDERMLKEKENAENQDARSIQPPTNSATTSIRDPAIPLPTPLQDYADLASEQDGDPSRSPITLSRNILEWVDAHPSQMSGANLPPLSTFVTDPSSSIHYTTDGLHINPSLTLDLPMALLNSTVLPSTSQRDFHGTADDASSHVETWRSAASHVKSAENYVTACAGIWFAECGA